MESGERWLFFGTIVLMVLSGIALDGTVNHGLFKVYEQEISLRVVEPEPLLSPPFQLDVSLGAIGAAIAIILFVVLIYEGRLNWESFYLWKELTGVKIINAWNLLIHHSMTHARRAKHLAVKAHPASIKASLLNHHQALRTSAKKTHSLLKKELTGTQDLFMQEYDSKQISQFVALIAVVAVVGLGVYAASPGLNPGVFSNHELPFLSPVQETSLPAELLSPTLDPWPLGIVFLIIFIVGVVHWDYDKRLM